MKIKIFAILTCLTVCFCGYLYSCYNGVVMQKNFCIYEKEYAQDAAKRLSEYVDYLKKHNGKEDPFYESFCKCTFYPMDEIK